VCRSCPGFAEWARARSGWPRSAATGTIPRNRSSRWRSCSAGLRWCQRRADPRRRITAARGCRSGTAALPRARRGRPTPLARRC
jgi:hypothetical protein